MKKLRKQIGSAFETKRQGLFILKPERKNVISVSEHNKICLGRTSSKNYSEIVIMRKDQKPVIINTVKITEIFSKFNK